MVAVRIDTGAEPRIAPGFSTDMVARSPHELRRFPLGARVPCWVNAGDRSQFTLDRRPAMSGIVAIAVLSVLALGLGTVARRL